MYKISELKNKLFHDIETAPEKPWEELDVKKKELWIEKYHYRFVEEEIKFRRKQEAILDGITVVDSSTIKTPTYKEVYTKYCPLIAEFAKVWCISFGVFTLKDEIEINTIQDEDEENMLVQWLKVLDAYESFDLAGYNIHDFDIPFVLKRMWINGLVKHYPRQYRLKDAKPWTIKSIDFMNDWKVMMRESVSLEMVCVALGIKSPKTVFQNYEFTTLLMEGKITVEDGVNYCERDVKALMEAMWKLSTEDCDYGEEVKKAKWPSKK